MNAPISFQLFLLQQKKSLPWLFLLFLEMDSLRKVRPSRTETFQSRPCMRQPSQFFLRGFWLHKCVRDFAKAMKHVRIYLKSSLQHFFFSHCSRLAATLFLCNSFQWQTPPGKMFSVFPWIFTVPLFEDIWLHDTEEFQYHVPDIAMRFTYTIRNKIFCLFFMMSQSIMIVLLVYLFLKNKETHLFWLPHHSFFLSNVFTYSLFFLLFYCPWNTFYMI